MDAIREAQALYKDAADALHDQRRQIEEDLEFSDPSDPQQWERTLKRQRENDPGGSRPCLVFDQCGQYVSNVAGNVEQSPPALHALPVDGGADKKVAEQLDGFYRHIEYASRASQHYARVLTSAARCGVGYLIVRPSYVNRALNWQEPRISSEGDPLRVVFDPWSQELDGSDATFGFLLTPYSHREFERQFKGKAKVSFLEADRAASDDARESIVVAESWQVENSKNSMVVCLGLDGDEMALSEDDYHAACQRAGAQLQVLRIYKDECKVAKWVQMSGEETLVEETVYPADGIGIVPVYGYVGWADGRMKYCGIPRRAREAQRSYNYHMSEMQAVMGQAAKAPYLIPMRAIGTENVKDLWDNASTQNRAFLPYVDFDELGAVNKPERMQPGVNLQNHIQGALQAKEDIQASIGMYQANLGAPSNESSGVAIDARKQQGEASTAHFPAHLAASITQVGKLCMQMIPKLMDTKRQLRILGIDGTPGQVTVDPGQANAVQETDKGLSINPNVGHYDVRVVVGASFATQRTQAQAAFTEMMRASPQLMPAIAPLWAQTLDVPNADKLSQVLTAVAPPEVRAVLQPEDSKQPKTADLVAQVEQLKQGLQEAIQHAHDAQQEADEAKQKEQEASDQTEVNWYKAETDRLKVTGANEEQIKVIVADLINSMLSSPAPLPGDPEQPEPMEGPGPDESAPHEMAEGEQPEPMPTDQPAMPQLQE